MGMQNQQLAREQGFFNLIVHYGCLGELLENTCRSRDLLVRGMAWAPVLVSVFVQTLQVVLEQPQQRISALGILIVKYNTGECLGGLWV